MQHSNTITTEKMLDSESNKGVLFYIKCVIAILFISWLLSLANIFIIDVKIMTVTVGLSIASLLVPIILCYIYGTENLWMKYVIIFFIELSLTILGVGVTYHSLLVTTLPLFFAMQYTDKRFLYVTVAMSVISIFITIMGGYYYGLCDANMVLLTVKRRMDYISPITGEFIAPYVNKHPWITLPFYYGVPRTVSLLLVVPVMQRVSRVISDNAISINSMQKSSELDPISMLYNGSKLTQMVKDYYPSKLQIGVAVINISNLRTLSEALGYESNTAIIRLVANALKGLSPSGSNLFRISNDEFVVIVNSCTELDINKFVHKCNKEFKNDMYKQYSLKIISGTSTGEGINVKELIDTAQTNAYIAKTFE